MCVCALYRERKYKPGKSGVCVCVGLGKCEHKWGEPHRGRPPGRPLLFKRPAPPPERPRPMSDVDVEMCVCVCVNDAEVSHARDNQVAFHKGDMARRATRNWLRGSVVRCRAVLCLR